MLFSSLSHWCLYISINIISIVFYIQFHFTINKRLDESPKKKTEYLENYYILHSMKDLVDIQINTVSIYPNTTHCEYCFNIHMCICARTPLNLHCECFNGPQHSVRWDNMSTQQLKGTKGPTWLTAQCRELFWNYDGVWDWHAWNKW